MEGIGSEVAMEKKLGSTQNLDDPMAVQHSDNPGMALVTVPLNDNNYLVWSRSMKRALAVKNKLGFVNGGITEPEEEMARSK